MNNFCTFCGTIIPEGRLVCPECVKKVGELGDIYSERFSIQSIVFPSFNSNPDGISADLFFKGCKIHCKGCHNKELQEFGQLNTSVNDILRAVQKNNVQILTLMGGEPLDIDIIVLIDLLRLLKTNVPALKISLFTGYALSKLSISILQYLDYIKVGSYDETQLSPYGSFLASKNQKFYKIVCKDFAKNTVTLREYNGRTYEDKDFILYLK